MTQLSQPFNNNTLASAFDHTLHLSNPKQRSIGVNYGMVGSPNCGSYNNNSTPACIIPPSNSFPG
eukprot:14402102-Ditylum_brightwellii.AAC.2